MQDSVEVVRSCERSVDWVVAGTKNSARWLLLASLLPQWLVSYWRGLCQPFIRDKAPLANSHSSNATY